MQTFPFENNQNHTTVLSKFLHRNTQVIKENTSFDGKTARLNLSSVTKESSGTYRVVVKNEHGSNESEATLTVQGNFHCHFIPLLLTSHMNWFANFIIEVKKKVEEKKQETKKESEKVISLFILLNICSHCFIKCFCCKLNTWEKVLSQVSVNIQLKGHSFVYWFLKLFYICIFCTKSMFKYSLINI